MAAVVFTLLNPTAPGGAVLPYGSGWIFNVNVAYKDSASGAKQVDAVPVPLLDSQLTSIAAFQQGIGDGVKAWLLANKGITATVVIVESWTPVTV